MFLLSTPGAHLGGCPEFLLFPHDCNGGPEPTWALEADGPIALRAKTASPLTYSLRLCGVLPGTHESQAKAKAKSNFLVTRR
jgi:hypothetical protein